jgi:hypothetical protein
MKPSAPHPHSVLGDIVRDDLTGRVESFVFSRVDRALQLGQFYPRWSFLVSKLLVNRDFLYFAIRGQDENLSPCYCRPSYPGKLSRINLGVKSGGKV